MDAQIDSSGDLAAGFPLLTDRLEAVAQRVKLGVMGHRGDWRFDLSAGLPWAAWQSQKPPQVEAIGALLRREIRSDADVERVEDWSASWDPDARGVSFAGTVITTAGALGLEFAAFGREGGNTAVTLTLTPSAVPTV